MRIFACSDIHVDFENNLRWVNSLSNSDFKKDILILAGDITDDIVLLQKVLESLRERFLQLLYVPGNHDLWVCRNIGMNTLEKFQLVKKIADNTGVSMKPLHFNQLSIVPLFGWYDYSFGQPSNEILLTWMDYQACKWPKDFNETSITNYFISMNEAYLDLNDRFIISFSHFVPRIDLLPSYIPQYHRHLFPVLGSSLLEKQIRLLGSNIHIYGHSHVNRQVSKENIEYINNAYGYPYETQITAKKLRCIFKT